MVKMHTVIPTVKGVNVQTSPADADLEGVSYFQNNFSVVHGLERSFQLRKDDFDVLVFLHDDVEIYDTDWQARVAAEFEDPTVAVVGFGGATALGDPDIYKRPYRIEDLTRRDYRSNQTDWETHGKQQLEPRDVAVLDGFMMAIDTNFLERINGWSGFPHNFHCYDTYICLMAARLGMRVRTVGVSCLHRGGGTSTSAHYLDWCKEHGTTAEREHAEPHRWIYENFREELPLVVH